VLKSLLVIGMVGAMGTLGFTYGMTKGDIPIVATLSASSPIVTVVVSSIFLKERLLSIQWIAIILMILSVIIISGFV